MKQTAYALSFGRLRVCSFSAGAPVTIGENPIWRNQWMRSGKVVQEEAPDKLVRSEPHELGGAVVPSGEGEHKRHVSSAISVEKPCSGILFCVANCEDDLVLRPVALGRLRENFGGPAQVLAISAATPIGSPSPGNRTAGPHSRSRCSI